MRKGRNYKFCSLLIIMWLVFIPIQYTVDPLIPDKHASLNDHSRTVADTFSVETMWDNIFASVSKANIINIVQTLSEDYPQRVWYPLDKAPSAPLEGAWEYVNDTISSFTSGDLHFNLMTEQLNLVAIKNGTDHSRAPIIIAGTISSKYSPGANAYAVSAAAVLEVARIMHSMSLTNDVYYVLVNTITSGGYSSPDRGNIGIEVLLKNLETQGREPAILIWFSRLLYHSTDVNGDKILASAGYVDTTYDKPEFLTDLVKMASSLSGSSMTLTTGIPGIQWLRSGCYEAWDRDISGVCLSQYYYYDGSSSSEDDSWDNWRWDYDLPVEAVGVAASLVAYLGSLGKGASPEFFKSGTVEPGSPFRMDMPLTGNSFVNVSVTWSSNDTIYARIENPYNITVYSRTEDDGEINLDYLIARPGRFHVIIETLGNTSVAVSLSYTHWQDFDGDTLNDYSEFIYGTNALSPDTDMDLLNDPDEITHGTEPTNADTDNDGALDGIEVIFGANPLIMDTDNDTLLDGFEIDYGLDPTSSDSDSDNINDAEEISLGLNPLSNDTDQDGLEDWAELMAGTNATNPDTDGDGLSDLFEVLNGLNPLLVDTDNDTLSDLYEVENGLLPFDPDSDHDSIPDSEDWAPKEHWISIMPTVLLGTVSAGLVIWLLMKRREYYRGGLQ